MTLVKGGDFSPTNMTHSPHDVWNKYFSDESLQRETMWQVGGSFSFLFHFLFYLGERRRFDYFQNCKKVEVVYVCPTLVKSLCLIYSGLSQILLLSSDSC